MLKWRIAPGQNLRHRVWGEECVLYNDLSGDTHLLGLAALDSLTLLRDRPEGTAGLAVALGLECDAATIDELGSLLGELRHLALIEAF